MEHATAATETRPQQVGGYGWSMLTTCAVLLSLALSGLTDAAPPTAYLLTKLCDPANTCLFPNAVNNVGTIVGSYGGFPAWWQLGWTAPQVLPGAMHEGDALDVNDRNKVVGYQRLGGFPNPMRAFFLSPPAFPAITTPRLPSGTVESVMVSANNANEVIGWGIGPNAEGGVGSVLRWTKMATKPVAFFLDTDELPIPIAINKAGFSAAQRGEDGEQQTTYTHQRGDSAFTPLPSIVPTMFAVNDLGWIAGDHGVVRLPSGSIDQLTPTCSGGLIGVGMTIYGMNNQVSATGVMDCQDPTTGEITNRAFRADHTNGVGWTYVDLNDLVQEPGCVLIGGFDISNTHYLSGIALCDGIATGVLLTPVVETVEAQ